MLKTTTRAVCFIILFLNLCDQINSECENNKSICCKSGVIPYSYNGKDVQYQRCNENDCYSCSNNQWIYTDKQQLMIVSEQSTNNDYQTQQKINFDINSNINENRARMQAHYQTIGITNSPINYNANLHNTEVILRFLGNIFYDDPLILGPATNKKGIPHSDVHLPGTTQRTETGGIIYHGSPSFESIYNTNEGNQPNFNKKPSYNEQTVLNDNIQNNNGNQKQNSVTDFSINLLKEISTDKNQNLIISPISVQFLLLLLEKGAEGPTKNELKHKIGSSSGEDLLNILRENANGLKTALGIFHDKSIDINTKYRQKIANLAQIYDYDFANSPQNSKKLINKWASENTEGKITDLISDNYNLQSVNVILLSAIYFHNTWKYKFEPINNQKFKLANGILKDTPFMEFTQNIPFYEIPQYKCTVINLPYENEKYSMVLIVPYENSENAAYNTQVNPLDQFIKNFDSTILHEILSTTKEKFERFIKLRMPKFSVKSELSVVQPLKQMGINKIFGSDSNLSGITSTNMYVSDILQQATLDVDENGTIAAAATSALLIPLSAGSKPRPTTFTVDRPFIAIILDQDNKTPLFISIINNPV